MGLAAGGRVGELKEINGPSDYFDTLMDGEG